jgi:hypothetical protein
MAASLFNVKKMITMRKELIDKKIQERKSEIDDICKKIEDILIINGSCTLSYARDYDYVILEQINDTSQLCCLRNDFELIKPDLERNGLIAKETKYEIQLVLPCKHFKYQRL